MGAVDGVVLGLIFFPNVDVSRIWLEGSGENVHESGFASAVVSYQTDTGSRFHPQVDIYQSLNGTEAF